MPAAEYPDTVFGRTPRAYGTGRDGKAVRYSVVHYTAGSESRSSAENGNAYDAVRTDGTSCHVFHDPDSSVQEVLRRNRSNSAMHKGNRLGIHHELCGTAQTREQWLDAASDAILWRAARAVAKDCVDYGLEPRRLSVAETRAAWYQFPGGPRGIVGHVDITRAYPEDGGDHTDPGTGFPWDIFIARVQQFMQGTPTPQENDVLADERFWLAEAAEAARIIRGSSSPKGEWNLKAALDEIRAAQSAPTPVTVDASAVAAALAENATFLAAVAKAVVDEDHARSAE